MKNKRKITKIVIDRDLCIGAAPCIVAAKSTFDLDDNGIAILKKNWQKSDDNDDAIIEAAKSCPVNAIELYDDNGKKIYPVDEVV